MQGNVIRGHPFSEQNSGFSADGDPVLPLGALTPVSRTASVKGAGSCDPQPIRPSTPRSLRPNARLLERHGRPQESPRQADGAIHFSPRQVSGSGSVSRRPSLLHDGQTYQMRGCMPSSLHPLGQKNVGGPRLIPLSQMICRRTEHSGRYRIDRVVRGVGKRAGTHSNGIRKGIEV